MVTEEATPATIIAAVVNIGLMIEIVFIEVSHQRRCHRVNQALLLQLRLNVELYAALKEIRVLKG